MNVLFLSTPGIRRRDAFTAILNSATSIYPRETIFTVPWESSSDSGSNVKEGIPILEDRLYSHNPARLLDKPAFLQRSEWRDAFQNLCKEFRHSRNKHFFLGAHLVYRFGQVPSVAADLRKLASWRPDCIVTLIDDIYCVRERVHLGGHKSFTFQDLLKWRLDELLLGDVLARMVDSKSPPPNYLMSVRHPVRKLVQLLFTHNPGAKSDRLGGRVYMSFNISDTRQTEEGRKEIDFFRNKFLSYENLFVFDPLTIDELPPVYFVTGRDKSGPPKADYFEYDPRDPRWRWPRLAVSEQLAPIINDDDLHSSYPLRLPTKELLAAVEAIDVQVGNRDIRLVDQAHYLGLWRPTMTRGQSVSAGVSGEMQFARERGVRMLAYMKKEVDQLPGSSFLKYLSPDNPDIKFDITDDEFWKNIEKIHKQKADRNRDHFLG